MWQERFKGIVVLFLLAFLVLGLVRYLQGSQQALSEGRLDLSPAKIEQQVLGVVNEIKRRAGGEPIPEDQLIDPVDIVEEKAAELLDEIKDLPKDQAAAAKQRVLQQVCQEIESLEFEATLPGEVNESK